ncbi:MAG: Gfo/Idh/MocA family oxidoreductase [Erysipelotrichaceae bacterium]|nr:Gfo/Idh/MocA family oxidoreductase [Erysipelotrichaceae bacterium]
MKLAIFGCGKIANRIAKSCLLVDNIDLVGFGSKDINKAKAYAEEYGCRDYGNYDHFLNGDVDAIYIATYNNSHYELIRECLKHHKNVICEKPMLFSVEQTEEAFKLARENKVLLMEALKSVFLPSIIKVKNMIADKVIGDTKEIYAAFMRCGNHPDTHWINDPQTGGAFKDLGSYCVGTINFLLDRKGKIASVEDDRTDSSADTICHALLDYDGIIGKVSVSNRLDGNTKLAVKGSNGCIEIENFWKNGKGYYECDGKRYEINEELISDFYYELKHFADLVDRKIKESPIMNEEASVDIIRITDWRNNQ